MSNTDKIHNCDYIPKWLTKAYLEDNLRSKFGNNLKVKDFKAAPAVPRGNNYLSCILRVLVECSENGVESERSLILKAPLQHEPTAKLLSDFYVAEMAMYSNYLPRIQNLLESIGDLEKIAPETIFLDPKNFIIVMSDLSVLGYKGQNRKIGLDLEHLQSITRKQAKLHACSMALAAQGEEFEDVRKSPFLNKESGTMGMILKLCFEIGCETQKWPGYETYGVKLKQLSERIPIQSDKLVQVKPGCIITLVHGDSWTNNFLFKYDKNGRLEEAILVDFQIGCFTSPMLDLVYTYLTSTVDDIKFDQVEFYKILQLYHQQLSNTLDQLNINVKPPTLFELHQEFHDRRFMEIIFSMLYALMLTEDEENAEQQNCVLDTDVAKAFRMQLYLNPRFVRHLKHFLPLWDLQGLLDPL